MLKRSIHTHVHALFSQRTSREILAIPLSNLHTRDSLIWMKNKSRTFSVKSAYQVAVRLTQQHDEEHSVARRDQPIWKKIWSLNVPPKVRTFLWRACSNSLPTRANLHRRKVQIESLCGACCQEPETTGHMLWECPPVRNVWALVKGKTQKCSNEARDFFLLFGHMARILESCELERWAILAWSIWNARNKFYFEHKQVHPSLILNGAYGLLDEYTNG